MEATLQSENVKHAAKIFEENSNMIRIAIRSKVNDKSIIDDIFQSLFVSLCHNPIPSNFENTEAFLRRAIRNDVIDAAIKRRCQRAREQRYARMHMVRVRYDDPEDTVTMCDTIQRIFEIIEDNLNAHEARAITERYRHGRDDATAAEAMGIAKRSFSRYLCTGLKKARKSVKENGLKPSMCF